jgi:CDP-diacylglycerol--serine O-phosphatidyltransferase
VKARVRGNRPRRGIPLRTIVPNAVTAMALCSGLFGIRFAIGGEWDKAVGAVVLAAILDGLDGRIARLLNGQSRFGAELDSLSDVTAFGVAPAIILYLWVLQPLGGDLELWNRYGWLFLLAYTVCAALRLARFNANIDAVEQPHKSAGFLTGVPAPAGSGAGALARLSVVVDRGAAVSRALGRGALGGGGRLPDDLEPRHLLVGLDAPAQPCQARRFGGDRSGLRGPDLGAFPDAERGRLALRPNDPGEYRELRESQKAACRRPGPTGAARG